MLFGSDDADDTEKPLPFWRRPRPVTEEEILERLEALQAALVLPCEIWVLLVETLCPDAVAPLPIPAEATDTMPGTNARMAVMAARAERGESVFHPGDPQWGDPGNDRIVIRPKVLRNGAVAWRDAPVEEQRHDGYRQVAPAAPDLPCPPGRYSPPEGFVVFAGLLDRPKRRRRPRETRPASARQLLLWPEDEPASEAA